MICELGTLSCLLMVRDDASFVDVELIADTVLGVFTGGTVSLFQGEAPLCTSELSNILTPRACQTQTTAPAQMVTFYYQLAFY